MHTGTTARLKEIIATLQISLQSIQAQPYIGCAANNTAVARAPKSAAASVSGLMLEGVASPPLSPPPNRSLLLLDAFPFLPTTCFTFLFLIVRVNPPGEVPAALSWLSVAEYLLRDPDTRAPSCPSSALSPAVATLASVTERVLMTRCDTSRTSREATVCKPMFTAWNPFGSSVPASFRCSAKLIVVKGRQLL